MVSERRHELAVRAALGATPGQTLRALMAHGAALTTGGILLGTLATLAAGNLLASLVHGVSPRDPATLALVAALVSAGALLACYYPARRAAAANPVEALREVSG
jgi:ABC-type antimicrobial peptide transport system permease subunit